MDIGVRKERRWDPGNEADLVATLESFWSGKKTQKPSIPPGRVISPLLTFPNLM